MGKFNYLYKFYKVMWQHTLSELKNIYSFDGKFILDSTYQDKCLNSYDSSFHLTLIMLLHYLVKIENSQ